MQKRKIELIWPDKYDNDGKLRKINTTFSFPFQKVEAINSPRIGKKRNGNMTLYDFWEGVDGNSFEEGWKNKLIWGDNKLVMSSLLKHFSGKIVLIYIDPPFATGADFKFKIKIGDVKNKIIKKHSLLEEKAYRDTWGHGLGSYLSYMYERLLLIKELLADNGSIYIHLDWHVGHYVKIIMDEIFGYDNFKSEIVWNVGSVSGFKSQKKGYIRQNDIILYYVKNPDDYIFNKEFLPYKQEYIDKMFKYKDENGRLYRKRRGGKQFLDESKGVPLGTVWDDIVSFQTATNAAEYLNFETQKPEALLKRIIMASSNPGDLIADFFCGSGTTVAVAEKLGRRWITCDLSRFAIHITRKRLLDIEKSKDLIKSNNNYNKRAKPFEILNLGKYERQYWQITTFNNKDEKQLLFEYLAFMLKLYEAEPISGFKYIHGKKGNAFIYIGSVDSPITIQEIINAINECKKVNQKEIHFLGWEWEMGLNNVIQNIAKNENILVKLRTIPNNVLEKQAIERGDIQFFELAYFKVLIEVKQKIIQITLKDFVIPHTDLISEEIKSKISKWNHWIDYWAIDFNFQNDSFNNNWTSFRTKKDHTLKLTARYKYDKSGKYKILIKVIDIFGVDTSQIYEVNIE
ncbi:MAG: site-specific DNA-methyltransferase [Candidatus Helarchaeota archaeon]